MSPIESDLAALRWPAADADLDTLLSRIGNFPNYLLVLIDGKLATAPDDKDRLLAAVFTTDAARNIYLIDLPETEKTALNQKLLTNCTGRELFSLLAPMPLHGIVFNCAGPDRPIAFVPALSKQALQRLDLESSGVAQPAPEAVANIPNTTPADVPKGVPHDFVALTKAALPDLQPGPRAAVNALWRAAFSLDQWLFIVHPNDATDRQPFVDTEAGRVCLFAFTDSEQVHRFAKENKMLDERGGALMLGVSPQNAIDWGRKERERGGSQRIHFNFSGPGWFAPMGALPGIYEFVLKSAE
jgi:hypothetical protein